jgi:hypothetical protein
MFYLKDICERLIDIFETYQKQFDFHQPKRFYVSSSERQFNDQIG